MSSTAIPVASREVPDALAADGLSLHADMISAEEEAELLAFIDSQPWDSTIKRCTQHYGRRFDYQTKTVANFAECAMPTPPLPQCVRALVQRLIRADPPVLPWDEQLQEDQVQVTVNEYNPGVGIAAHVDTHSAFTDGIASLSLGAGITFRMQHCSGHADHAIWLPPRSLLVMSGAARYVWRHSISSRRYDLVERNGPEITEGDSCAWIARSRRISVTLRCVLINQRCACNWPQFCDAQDGAALELPTRLRRQGYEQAKSTEASQLHTCHMPNYKMG